MMFKLYITPKPLLYHLPEALWKADSPIIIPKLAANNLNLIQSCSIHRADNTYYQT